MAKAAQKSGKLSIKWCMSFLGTNSQPPLFYCLESLAQRTKELLWEVAQPSFDVVLGTVCYWLVLILILSVYKTQVPCCKPSKNTSFWDEQWKKRDTWLQRRHNWLQRALRCTAREKEKWTFSRMSATDITSRESMKCIFSVPITAVLPLCSQACLCYIN